MVRCLDAAGRALIELRETVDPSPGVVSPAAAVVTQTAPQQVVTTATAPLALAPALSALVRFLDAVGLPELLEPGVTISKAPTLLRVHETSRGPAVELWHRAPRSKERVVQAADAIADLMRALGRRVAYRDVMPAPGVGWRASLVMGA